MASSRVPPIGARLRTERRRRGVSVRGLAREIGVSASLISQIETEKSSPSVSTLYAMTTALGISIEDLFDDAPTTDPAGIDTAAVDDDEPGDEPDALAPLAAGVAGGAPVGAATRGGVPASPVPSENGSGAVTAGMAAVLGAAVGAATGVDKRLGPVVRPDAREVLTLDSGVTWELLGRIPHKHVDFLLITYPPGGTSSSSGLLMRHSGTEFGFVISGRLTLTLGFEAHHLTAGDAVSFDSSNPHAYRNESTEPAVGVWFVVERSA